MRASHLHLMVEAPGHRTLVTHVFPRGDAYLASDSVFGVRDSLVVDVRRQPPRSPTPDGRGVDGPWSRIAFDIVLAPASPM
jgi:hydroxyquinol 1,2-dioxygenase